MEPWTDYNPKALYFIVQAIVEISENGENIRSHCNFLAYLGKDKRLWHHEGEMTATEWIVSKGKFNKHLTITPLSIPQPSPNIDLADFINAFLEEHKHSKDEQ